MTYSSGFFGWDHNLRVNNTMFVMNDGCNTVKSRAPKVQSPKTRISQNSTTWVDDLPIVALEPVRVTHNVGDLSRNIARHV